MYFQYCDLRKKIEDKDFTIKNFFDTFGFVVVKGVLDKSDFKSLLEEYDFQYSIRSPEPTAIEIIKNRLGFTGEVKYGFRMLIKQIIGQKGMRFLPNFVDGSEKYTNYFFSDKFQSIYQYFAGDNWLYLGSDGSNFKTTSFPWHRDWFTKIPILKFNFYYNPLPFLGGRFLIIPGSNFSEDAYSQLIQKSMSWPMQNKKAGGLSENSRLPLVKNPRELFANLFKKLTGKSNGIDVPHVKVKLSKGDLIIFDHRALHCVENNFPKFQRRLMTILLSKNAFDFSDEHYLFPSCTPESLMTEIVDLVVGERNHIKCPPYGEAILRHPIAQSQHFIEIEKLPGADVYNRGSFKLSNGNKFVSVFDFNRYGNIGSEYRKYFNQISGNVQSTVDKNNQSYSYEDVHLGVNAQNIRKISS